MKEEEMHPQVSTQMLIKVSCNLNKRVVIDSL